MCAKWGDIGVELRLNLGMGTTRPRVAGGCNRVRRTTFETVEGSRSARLDLIVRRIRKLIKRNRENIRGCATVARPLMTVQAHDRLRNTG
jgi:hypothetical protein